MTAHAYQYNPLNSAITRSSGCTWVTGATGIAVVTDGRYQATPDKIHSLVKRTEETNPSSPGWSLEDLDLAVSRYGMGFEVHKNEGWAAVQQAFDDRRFIVIQGDSDRFGNATCSGTYDGLHAVGVEGGRRKIEAGVEWWWLHDPICPTGRWERKRIIREYAEKLAQSVFMGWFVQRVPWGEDWTWQYDPPGRGSFAVFTVENGRIRSVTRISTRATSVYRCTEPGAPTPWPGHESVPLVRLGNLVSGKPGPHTGEYVNARYASKETA